jgi:hypothetical protein
MKPTLVVALTVLAAACSGAGSGSEADAGGGPADAAAGSDAEAPDAGAADAAGPDAFVACPEGDGDGDGACDPDDPCIDDPAKVDPGVCGCGVSDDDGDGDGAADCVDACPADPGKTAPGVCDCGAADVDGDGDGTMDCTDVCAADPDKTLPGACGCGVADTDADSDGHVDCGEGCPADPTKSAPGVCGCGIPDTDSDTDGTANCVDGCPADPGKTGPGLCGCGTSDTDTDSDGTANCNDGCPADPAKTGPGICGCGTSDADGDADGTASCNDGCPADPGKIAPGVCGCGNADDPDFSASRDEVMFVTAASAGANLRAGHPNGQQGADDRCQDAAEAAGLGRDFVAVLGGGGIGGLDDRVRLCGRITNRNGTVLFTSRRDMLAPGAGVPLSTTLTDAQGTAVPPPITAWTGLDTAGNPSNSCSQFMSSSTTSTGRTGSFTATAAGGWLGGGLQSCSSSARLYCISQLPPVQVGLDISPASPTVGLVVTDTAQLTALARLSYGPRADVTAAATWESSDPALAVVAAGTVVFSGPGSVTITAAHGGFTAMTTVTATEEWHQIFITSQSWPLGTGDNVDFQLGNNATCQAAASGAGLPGSWLGVYATGFVRDELGPITIGGPVLNLDGEVVGFPNLGSAAPITTDEYGTALPDGATAWTSECAYDFLANKDVAGYGTATSLFVAKLDCVGARRRICIREYP